MIRHDGQQAGLRYGMMGSMMGSRLVQDEVRHDGQQAG
jgi:hypothetical protein